METLSVAVLLMVAVLFVACDAQGSTTSELSAKQLENLRHPDDEFEILSLVLEPKTDTVFETLLSKMPDNPTTRARTRLSDSAGVLEALGVEPLQPGYTTDELTTFFKSIVSRSDSGRINDGFVPPTLQWPLELRNFADSLDLLPDLGFDMASADSFAQTGRFFLGGRLTLGDGQMRDYEVALGSFDLDATRSTLSNCDCDQPEVRQHSGMEYYAWSDGTGKQSLARRLERPFYDNLGRGPHLLVRPGEAYYSVWDGVIDEHIDVIQGNAPSLADYQANITASQLIASMGIISQISLGNFGYTVEEIIQGGCCAESVEEVVQGQDLLLSFEMVAIGTGFDGERSFVGLVIAHDGPENVEPNIERLLARLRHTAPIFGGRNPVPPLAGQIDLIEISNYEEFLIARIHSLKIVVDGRNSIQAFFSLTSRHCGYSDSAPRANYLKHRSWFAGFTSTYYAFVF